MDSKKLVELALSLGNDERASRLARKGTGRTNRLIRDIRKERFDERDWKRLKGVRKSVKPRTVNLDTEIPLEDLIREAEELDAKGKLSESDLNRIQEIRNEASSRLLGDRYTVDDIIKEAIADLDSVPTKTKYVRTKKETPRSKELNQFGGAMDDIDLDRELEIGRDIDMIFEASLPKEKVGEKPVKPVTKSGKWDPLAQEETDLLDKYAKEDSLERGRDKLKTQRDVINDYGDMAYKEGYNDPENRRILFDAMDELGADYEDAIKMIKGDISGLTGNPRFANDPMVREAFENYLYEKGFPIEKIDQLNKETGGSVVSREALTEREKMLRLLEEIEAQTGIDKMFTTKLRDDASAVGGVVDETPAEIRGMSNLGRSKMNDDLKNKLVAYRTRKGATTGVDIDDVLLNPYLSTKDLSKSKRVQNYLREEEAGLRRKYNINPETDIKPLRDVHPQKGEELPERLRASDIRDKSEIIEDAINKRYGSVDNLRKINSDVPEGAEHIVDEANSWLNAYDDAVDTERKLMDFEDNRQAESIADQFLDPAVLERRYPTPRSRDYGEETMYLKEKVSETMQKKRDFVKERQKSFGLNLPEKEIDKILWSAKNTDDVNELLSKYADELRNKLKK